MIGQSETQSRRKIIFVTLFCSAFYQPQESANCAEMLGHFGEPKEHVLTFLHPISMAGSHAENWGCS
jgi:hypothetical protein